MGEGGHFIDTVSALVGLDPVEVHACGGSGGVNVTLRYDDGSTGLISYLTEGSSRFPKESLDVTGDGRTGRLDDFTRTTLWTARGRTVKRSLTGRDKGQREQLRRFVAAVRDGGPMPVPLDSLVATTRATLAVQAALTTRRPVALPVTAPEGR